MNQFSLLPAQNDVDLDLIDFTQPWLNIENKKPVKHQNALPLTKTFQCKFCLVVFKCYEDPRTFQDDHELICKNSPSSCVWKSVPKSHSNQFNQAIMKKGNSRKIIGISSNHSYLKKETALRNNQNSSKMLKLQFHSQTSFQISASNTPHKQDFHCNICQQSFDFQIQLSKHYSSIHSLFILMSK